MDDGYTTSNIRDSPLLTLLDATDGGGATIACNVVAQYLTGLKAAPVITTFKRTVFAQFDHITAEAKICCVRLGFGL